MARCSGLVFSLVWLSLIGVSGADTSSGQMMRRLPQFDGRVRRSAPTIVHHAVSTAGKCGLLCNLHGVSGCDHFFYNDVTKECVTCPFPCISSDAMVLENGFQLYIVNPPSCPTEKGYYEYYHNASSRQCLRLELDNAADWTTALDNCLLDGGHLADFKTDQEYTDIVDYISNVRGYQPSSENFVFLGVYKESGQWTWWDHSAVASGILDGKWQTPPYGFEPTNGVDEIYIAISAAYLMLHDIPSYWVKLYLCEIDLIA